jgi:transcriptional regulator with XRE-family HTH domain
MAPHETLDPARLAEPATLHIGATIRGFRQQRGLSQGDIERRTGLLRCYLSRVENGHTMPSLDTLKKIALALELDLSEFFATDTTPDEVFGLTLKVQEIRFLTQIQRYASSLSESDRRLLLGMARNFASS